MGSARVDGVGNRMAEPINDSAKRILALDGGGVRGAVSLGFLESMEAELRHKMKDDTLTLGRHFHLIGGTSVGSIIATMLALDWTMEMVSRTFLDWCPDIFSKPRWLWPLRTKFNERVLRQKLDSVLGDMRLDDPRLVTMLAIVTKRLDTGSPWWVVANNPKSKWWKGEEADHRNHDFRVAELVRASTAAPTIFKPQRLPIGKGLKPGTFVDGALSPFNNPSLLLLMLASLKGHGLEWPMGPERMMLISVGTGSWREPVSYRLIDRLVSAWFGVKALRGMVADSQTLSLAMLQWMSEPRLPWPINNEIGTLSGECLLAGDRGPHGLFRFQRYDLDIERDAVAPFLPGGKRPSRRRIGKLRSLDNPCQIRTLYQAAKMAAEQQVNVDDFL